MCESLACGLAKAYVVGLLGTSAACLSSSDVVYSAVPGGEDDSVYVVGLCTYRYEASRYVAYSST